MLTSIFHESEPSELKAPRGTYKEGEQRLSARVRSHSPAHEWIKDVSNKVVTAIKALPPFIGCLAFCKKEREQLKPPDWVLDPPKRLTILSNLILYWRTQLRALSGDCAACLSASLYC